MVAAAKDLEVGAAGKRNRDPYDEFALAGAGYLNLLDAHIFFAVKDRGGHHMQLRPWIQTHVRPAFLFRTHLAQS
jgi:hypothetical protein